MDDLLVLCYHGISDSWPADEAVTPAALEEHLEALLSRGYVGATLSQALTVPPAPRALVVSFDDAHRSVLEAAAPILAERGRPGDGLRADRLRDLRRADGLAGATTAGSAPSTRRSCAA